MAEPRRVAVLDIGKTNVKLALVDLAALAEIEVLSAANVVLPAPPYPHVDTERIWAFLLDGLARLHAAHGIDAVNVSAHGGTGALLDAEGGLAAPILDYEHDGPDELAAAYGALRPDFAETGSPRLPGGLNLGAQLHWQLETVPGLRGRLATVVPYPQYWTHRLTGAAVSEATSLGAHTDLWAPGRGTFSALAARLGVAERMAPVRRASEAVGPLRPELAARTGLAAGTSVFCGVHDSNASLYPYLLTETPPFAVVATGTWVIAMAVGGAPPALDPARDTLVNVDVHGGSVPSARFMGGRERELALGSDDTRPSEAETAAVLDRRVMLEPSLVAGCGPFPGRAARWTGTPRSEGERAAAVAFYLALMTETCLSLTGARGPVIVEGPFADNAAYLGMLAVALGRPVIPADAAMSGPRLGAALLTAPGAGGRLPRAAGTPPPLPRKPDGYIAAWRTHVEAGR